jgi:hypothetical protein
MRIDPEGPSQEVIADSASVDVTLSRVQDYLALTRRTGSMAIRLFDLSGRPVQRLEPRMSVVDSLTFGTLGVPGSSWSSGSAKAFFDGGLVQPIADLSSGRTIMMLYSREGFPVGWPLMRGATIEFFSLDVESSTMLGLVGYDDKRRIQRLRWNRAR